MTAVIYARYSSDNQREESIEGQIRECTAYAEKNGITIVKHYIDRAISAKTDNRPEFQQMIKDSDKKLFDIVLVWKLDRFARNRYDSARYKTQLKKNGVKLMSATEIISEGPEGIILESVLEGYAEYYSADLAEKVVRGQTENILKGRCNGGRGTFGYTLDSERKFHIDPLTSPFVLESFKKYNEGSTMKEIRDWLNENGIKNPVGGAFTYNSVEHMLKNRRYIGELKFRDVVVPDAIPPIIPLELFEDVQEKIAKNKKAPARRKAEDDYLLTTKLFCGYCGALMFGESGTSRTGEVHRYYKCATAKKHKGCKKKTVRKQWLEDLVVNQTMRLVRDDAAMESIIAKVMELQDRENTNLPLYEKQLRDAESGIQNMLNAIQAGILTSSTKERLEQLEARIAEEKLAKPKVTEEFIRFWLLRFRKLDMSLKDQRQALVDTFINAIYLYDDKVLITFNYKEGTQTITFEEAAQAASKGNGSDLDCLAALLNDSFQKGCRFSFLYPSFWKRSAMRIRGLEQHGPAAGGATKAPVGLLLVRGGSAHICTSNGHPTVGGVFYGFSDALHPARAGRQARRFGSPGGLVQPVFPAAGQRAGPGPAAQPARRPGRTAPAAGDPAQRAVRSAHDRRHPRGLPPEECGGVPQRAGARRDGRIRAGTVLHRAAAPQPPARPGRLRGRSGPCRLAGRRPLRLSDCKFFKEFSISG